MKIRKKLTSSQFIALGYLIVIIFGTLVLSLPISSKDGNWTDLLSALFTSTTSTCVTGLVVFDTFTHWSLFGQITILVLIQIGGIGFMTIISLMGMFLKRKLNVGEQKIIMQASGTIRLSDTLSIIKKIVLFTICFEITGAIMLSISLIPKLGVVNGIYYSIFHSISAFCNAGIDLMGRFGEFSSLSMFKTDYLFCITIMLLVITGGLGFLVWSDLFDCKGRFKRMQLHTRIVLVSTVLLIIVPAMIIFFIEYNKGLDGLSFYEKILNSLFQSVTTRTAGFNTLQLDKLSDGVILLMSVLMIVGGSPGSTAGGIKTTTFVVLILSIAYTFKSTKNITIGKKQLDKNILKQACSLLMLYLGMVIVSSILICSIESHISLREVIFETSSAIATVGLTLGITTTLSSISKIILILMMYIGRIGGISLLLLFEKASGEDALQRPIEKILIG